MCKNLLIEDKYTPLYVNIEAVQALRGNDDFIGHEHEVGKNQFLRNMIESNIVEREVKRRIEYWTKLRQKWQS